MPRTQGFHTFTAAAQITSLVGEVRSCKPCSMAKKETHADTHTHTTLLTLSLLLDSLSLENPDRRADCLLQWSQMHSSP